MNSRNKTLILGIVLGMIAHYGYVNAVNNRTK